MVVVVVGVVVVSSNSGVSTVNDTVVVIEVDSISTTNSSKQ